MNRHEKAADPATGGFFDFSWLDCQAKATFALRRRIVPPTRPKPASIIAQLAGSGAADMRKA